MHSKQIVCIFYNVRLCKTSLNIEFYSANCVLQLFISLGSGSSRKPGESLELDLLLDPHPNELCSSHLSSHLNTLTLEHGLIFPSVNMNMKM